MPKKSVREMNFLERQHNSLSAKMFHLILQFSLILSLFAVGFGFYLYTRTLREQYTSIAHNVAKTTNIVFQEENADSYIDKVLDIYQSIPEDIRLQVESEAYLSKFAEVRDEKYERIRKTFNSIQKENEMESLYIAAYDRVNHRLIYIIDSDDTLTACHPGYWDPVDVNPLELNDPNTKPAIIERTDKYGYLLTSYSILREKGDYIIAAFTDVDLNAESQQARRFLIQYWVLILIVTLLLDFLIIQRMKKQVVHPIASMNEAARDFIKARGRNLLDEETYFDKLDIHTGDEIESLSLIMADMEKDLKENVRDLEAVSAEKEKIGAELNVASQIQEGVLPNIFPAFPDKQEFDIYATMQTAKEVGGDFYDFFLMDEEHLAIVMADVSGKGIPAALFMMGSKIVINNVATMGIYDPAKVLTIVNKQITKSNPAEMFVTVWLGILDLKTGILKAANAGHEYPCITLTNEKFEMLRDKHGLVLGGFADSKYTSYEVQLKPGDGFFVYTDGVTEATNANEELFGNQRLLEALNSNPTGSPKQILTNVKEAIDAFVGDAPQFDDITMLAVRYLGERNMEELTIDATIDNIPTVTEFVDKKLEELDCPMKAQMQIDVAIDELFSNIANYAYHPETGPATVRVEVEENPMAVVITFIDHGMPYDPLKNEDPDITLGAEEREVGGLGVFLVKKTMDDVTYEYKDGKNILKIKKHI